MFVKDKNSPSHAGCHGATTGTADEVAQLKAEFGSVVGLVRIDLGKAFLPQGS